MDDRLGVIRSARFHRDTALAQGLRRILAELQDRLELEQQVGLYLAGGLAVHLYTGQRVTTDIDAEFTARVAIPRDLMVDVVLVARSGNKVTLRARVRPHGKAP